MADEEDDLELQDQPAAPVAPPQPVAPPAPTPMPPQAIQPAGPNRPVAGPGYIYMGQNAGPAASRPVGLPSVSAQPWLNQVADYQKDMVGNAMMKDARSDPNLATAQKAVQAATQYQAQRGYDKDLQGGMPADQAMAKWGPMLFGQSGAGMSRMASAIKATRQPPVRLHNLSPGQTAFSVGPDGKLTPAASLPKAASDEKPNAIIDAQFKAAKEEMENNSDYEMDLKDKDPKRQAKGQVSKDKFERAQATVNAITKKFGMSSDTEPAAASPKEVRRRTKDGRIAVYNASTKEFIRYAD